MSSDFTFDITKCARSNILKLQPYRCARDDYKDDGTNVLLDANENAYGPGLDLKAASQAIGGLELDSLKLNRYPDPHQEDLKQLICNLRNTNHHTTKPLTPANLFVGVGSDEAIDALLRCFCAPARDKILTCPPTYGMYAVSAQVNDLEIVSVPLMPDGLDLDADAILRAIETDGSIKLMYLCSPGNPTGRLLSKSAIHSILNAHWNGIVVIDEAYVDFASAPDASLAQWTTEFPNLVVMQTLSKAFGLAAIRLGVAFASSQVVRLLNSLKAPYNISTITSVLGAQALSPASLSTMQTHVGNIVQQRERLVAELPRIRGVGKFRGGFDANFVLVQMLNATGEPENAVALQVYERLAEDRGVVVRFRGKEKWCEGCLRITVGTEEEVTRFLGELRVVLEGILGGKDRDGTKVTQSEERKKEESASQVVN